MTITETSKEAFSKVDESNQSEMVLKALHTFGKEGATCEEVFNFLPIGLHYGTISARFTGLKDKGQIFPTGLQHKTTSGNMADVFIHKNFATPEQITAFVPKVNLRKLALDEFSEIEGFLAGMKKANACDGIWFKGIEHRLQQITKIKESLK